jgi:hypothetical protein
MHPSFTYIPFLRLLTRFALTLKPVDDIVRSLRRPHGRGVIQLSLLVSVSLTGGVRQGRRQALAIVLGVHCQNVHLLSVGGSVSLVESLSSLEWSCSYNKFLLPSCKGKQMR